MLLNSLQISVYKTNWLIEKKNIWKTRNKQRNSVDQVFISRRTFYEGDVILVSTGGFASSHL
jgi:hypothetical protein